MIEEMKNENLPMKNENLPAVADHDGFDDTNIDDHLIQGTIVRCVDGIWSAKDEASFSKETRLIVLKSAEALQRWENQRPVETIPKHHGEALPDLDELNAKIPKKRWEKGLDGEPREPWVHQYIVYLLNPKDASVFTFINSTMGARVAVERLRGKVKMMRALRGEKVCPIVELSAKPMKTGFGLKQRPDFVIHDWCNLGGPRATSAPALEHVGEPVKPVSTKEELDDEILF